MQQNRRIEQCGAEEWSRMEVGREMGKGDGKGEEWSRNVKGCMKY